MRSVTDVGMLNRGVTCCGWNLQCTTSGTDFDPVILINTPVYSKYWILHSRACENKRYNYHHLHIYYTFFFPPFLAVPCLSVSMGWFPPPLHLLAPFFPIVEFPPQGSIGLEGRPPPPADVTRGWVGLPKKKKIRDGKGGGRRTGHFNQVRIDLSNGFFPRR